MPRVAPGDVDSKTTREVKSPEQTEGKEDTEPDADFVKEEGFSTDDASKDPTVVDTHPNFVPESYEAFRECENKKQPGQMSIIAVANQGPFDTTRSAMRLTDVLPVVVVIAMIVALATIVTMYLPQKMGKNDNPNGLSVAGFGRSLSMPLRQRGSNEGACGPPPEPMCLAWDWTYNGIRRGFIVNYWCVTTSSFNVYIKMECIQNGTWKVIMRNSMPCNCHVPWLSNSVILPINLLPENTGICPAFVQGSCKDRCIPNKERQCPENFLCCRKHLHSTKFCCFKPIRMTTQNASESPVATKGTRIKVHKGLPN